MVVVDTERNRLARCLSDFWYNGAGPSHDDIDRVFDDLEIDAYIEPGSKREKVHQAVVKVNADDLPKLVSELVDLLSSRDSLVPDENSDSQLTTLNKRLRPYNMQVTAGGEVIGGQALGVEPSRMIDLPGVQQHISRIQLALNGEDAALLLGSSKELLETTCKFVLTELNLDIPDKFPSLLAAALKALGLHPSSVVSSDPEQSESIKRILGGLTQIGIGINELRNSYGTGHGRADAGVGLSLRHARFAAGSAAVLATIIIDTFQDPGALWRKG